MKELNLIPYSLKEKKQRILKTRQYIALCMLLLLVLFSGVYFLNVKLVALGVEEQGLLENVNANRSSVEESKTIINVITNYTERLKIIEYVSKGKSMVSDKMKELQAYVPSDIKLRSLSYTKDGIVAVGISTNYDSISEFQANLQTSKKFKNVIINSIGKNGTETIYNFTINIKY